MDTKPFRPPPINPRGVALSAILGRFPKHGEYVPFSQDDIIKDFPKRADPSLKTAPSTCQREVPDDLGQENIR